MGTSKFCDLCGQVIKNTYWLYLGTQCTPNDVKHIYDLQDIVNAVKDSQTGQCDDFEICEDCRTLMQRIFTYKKEKVGAILDELDSIYNIVEHKEDE
jgi:hypothetical protein